MSVGERVYCEGDKDATLVLCPICDGFEYVRLPRDKGLERCRNCHSYFETRPNGTVEPSLLNRLDVLNLRPPI